METEDGVLKENHPMPRKDDADLVHLKCRVSPELGMTLKRIALEEHSSIQALLMEGIDHVLLSRRAQRAARKHAGQAAAGGDEE